MGGVRENKDGGATYTSTPTFIFIMYNHMEEGLTLNKNDLVTN